MLADNTPGRRAFKIFNTLLMIIIAFLCLAPFIHVLFASISDPALVNKNEDIILFPLGRISFHGYKLVFGNPSIGMGYLNTLFYVVIGTLVSLVLTVLGAYAFSRKQFMLRNALMFLATFTMLFNGGMIPNFLLVKNLGLIDSRWAIILPTAINVFNLIIMRTSFMQIPDSLEESARIDGAGDLVILVKIILPVSKAVIAVVVLFTAVSIWNSWFSSALYLNSRDKFPLQIILREILIQNDMSSTVGAGVNEYFNVDLYKQLVKYCTIIVSTVPILCVYPFVQKYFVKGIMIGSLKG
ncbi:MAG TPA: carbohydrate ABC transporter permease [Clostridia bacterium]|nr:carbohydrate ABC transporter permease [Clostridia bacterium]